MSGRVVDMLLFRFRKSLRLASPFGESRLRDL